MLWLRHKNIAKETQSFRVWEMVLSINNQNHIFWCVIDSLNALLLFQLIFWYTVLIYVALHRHSARGLRPRVRNERRDQSVYARNWQSIVSLGTIGGYCQYRSREQRGGRQERRSSEWLWNTDTIAANADLRREAKVCRKRAAFRRSFSAEPKIRMPYYHNF